MGRKRIFEIDEALDAAMQVFWAKGYDGSSLDDLTAAIGVSRPSIYGCFGNKEDLFRQVLQRYEMTRLGFAWRALQEPTALEVITGFIDGFLDLATDPSTPNGCLGVNALMCGSEASTPIRVLIQRRTDVFRAALSQRFEQAILDGDLGSDQAPEVLANLVIMLVCGLSIQAQAGVPKPALAAAIRAALQGLAAGPGISVGACRRIAAPDND